MSPVTLLHMHNLHVNTLLSCSALLPAAGPQGPRRVALPADTLSSHHCGLGRICQAVATGGTPACTALQQHAATASTTSTAAQQQGPGQPPSRSLRQHCPQHSQQPAAVCTAAREHAGCGQQQGACQPGTAAASTRRGQIPAPAGPWLPAGGEPAGSATRRQLQGGQWGRCQRAVAAAVQQPAWRHLQHGGG